MTEIKEGLVFSSTNSKLKLRGPHRVLQVIPEEEGTDSRVVLILYRGQNEIGFSWG
jgi:hypothetical protein